MYAVVFHAHQKLDRAAFSQLKKTRVRSNFFPALKQIIYFEGSHGPDGAKLKRPSKVAEQPWHFINPNDPSDNRLIDQINNHYKELVNDLRSKDSIRSGFEAAWLAHALIDGLTPAHHYPYEEELQKIRGEDRTTRQGILGRAYVKGENMRQSLAKSMMIVGPKGLLTTHAIFEARAYAVIKPLNFKQLLPNDEEYNFVVKNGITQMFKKYLNEIAEFNMYNSFYNRGWTRDLSKNVRLELAPRMVKIITLAWYAASVEAEADIL